MNNGGTDFRSPQAANAVGQTELRLTFTVGNAGLGVRLGGDTADIWWDDLMIVEGTYTGGYGDGSSAGWIWNGIPNASTSTGPAR